jgi:cysteine desulfuration protein SufE
MSEQNSDGIPQRLAEIIEDFQLAEGREKLELLLDYSEQLPPLPERFKEQHAAMEHVEECMTPVFVQAELNAGHLSFYFDVPRESPTVRGFAALLEQGLQGLTPEQILQVPGDFYIKMSLHQVLTQQRMHGISAILAHMKQLALQNISGIKTWQK